MKSVRSMPALARVVDAQEHNRPSAATMRRSHSMSTHPDLHIRSLIQSMPFVAFPGMGSHLTRALSKSAIHSAVSSTATSPNRTTAAKYSTGKPSLLPSYYHTPYTTPLLLSVLTAVLASFQVGYNSGVINVPADVIRYSLHLTEWEWSVVVSIYCVGGLLGSFFGGRFADLIGRKNLFISNNVLFIVGGLCEALSTNFFMIAFGRIVIGLASGVSTVVVPLYLGEIAPANLRGSLGTMNQFAIVIGILIANVLGRPLGGINEWRYLLGLVLLPSTLQLCFSAFLLESPLWLIMQHDNKAMVLAEEVLCALRGHDEVKFELDVLAFNKAEQQTHAHTPLIQALQSVQSQRALTVGLTLQLAQQLSGINCVFFYSSTFFARSAHVTDAWLPSVAASAVNFLATAAAIPLMDRMGRRVLLIASSVGMLTSCIGLTIVLYLNAQVETPSDILSTLSIVGVLTYVSAFEIGLGPIPWLIGAELYPSRIRAAGMSLNSIINWSANFMVSLLFPHINNILQTYTFVPFAIILIFVTIFISIMVPETRGKSLEQIQEELMDDTPSDHRRLHQKMNINNNNHLGADHDPLIEEEAGEWVMNDAYRLEYGSLHDASDGMDDSSIDSGDISR